MAKILIMEDDEFQAEALQFLLEDLGHQAEICYSAKAALSKLQVRKYDLLITDLLVVAQDEKGGGITLIKEVRGSQFPFLRSMPIIAITGSGKLISPELLGESADIVGANHVMMKPIEMLDLRRSIDKVLKA